MKAKSKHKKLGRPAETQRNILIAKGKYELGMTPGQLAKAFGLTKGRIHVLLATRPECEDQRRAQAYRRYL